MLLIITLLSLTKTPINFWCKQKLNFRSLIQPSETLPIELTETHIYIYIYTHTYIVLVEFIVNAFIWDVLNFSSFLTLRISLYNFIE